MLFCCNALKPTRNTRFRGKMCVLPQRQTAAPMPPTSVLDPTSGPQNPPKIVQNATGNPSGKKCAEKYASSGPGHGLSNARPEGPKAVQNTVHSPSWTKVVGKSARFVEKCCGKGPQGGPKLAKRRSKVDTKSKIGAYWHT